MPSQKQANNKTRPRSGNVVEYIHSLEHKGRKEDALTLLLMMSEITGEEAQMWRPSIVGFGQYHYVYESGREGDSFLTGFAPRKANMVVYIMPGFSSYKQDLSKLGKHKLGRSCLYLGRLQSIDLSVLRNLVEKSVDDMKCKWG